MPNKKRFTLRMEQALFDDIKGRAIINKRSVAMEMVFMMEKEIKRDKNRDNPQEGN